MFEELRKAELRKVWLDAQVERVSKFLRTYGCPLANHTDITNEIRGMMNNRGEQWPWVDKWATEAALAWVNPDISSAFDGDRNIGESTLFVVSFATGEGSWDFGA